MEVFNRVHEERSLSGVEENTMRDKPGVTIVLLEGVG